MKPIATILATGLMVVVGTACAQKTTSLALHHPVAKATVDMSRVLIDGKCHFRVKAVSNQGYIDGTYMFYGDQGNPMGWGFGFACHSGASQEQIDQRLDAKKINGTWVWYNPGAGNVPENPPFTQEQHFHAYVFFGKSWKGTAVTYDDTTGDEATRGRNLFFCLVEKDGPQVLCGGPISVMALVDPPSTSTLPKILAVLKSIEFIDPLTTPASAASTAVGH